LYIDSKINYRYSVTDMEKAGWPKDANGKFVRYKVLISQEQWMDLCRRHPGVLLIPEHTLILCYTACRPIFPTTGRWSGSSTISCIQARSCTIWPGLSKASFTSDPGPPGRP
jgi:hypothetical protein